MLSLKNINLLELEDLRDKKEIKLYFKTKNIELTNEDIEKLKDLFSNIENNKYSLTIQQLEKIAGGESSELLIRKRAFSLLRGTKGIFAVNPAPVGKILLKNPEVDAVPASKGLQRVDVGTEPKIEVLTSESPEIEVVESHHGKGSSTTGKQVHGVDLPKREQLRVEQHGQLTLKKHSILGFDFGGEIKIENSHLRALFDEKSRHIGAVKELVAQKISELKQAQKDLETVSSPQENAVARMILMREKERIQGEITHFKSIESGEIILTWEEMNHVFNGYYHKEGLAESIISAMCPDQSWYNRVSFKSFDTDKKIIHCMDEYGKQHLVDLRDHSVITEEHKLNQVVIDAMQGLEKHDTYRIGDTDITHIGNLTDKEDHKKVTRSLFRANLPDGSKQVFDSNGNSLLKVNELGRVESMEPNFYCIIAKMMDFKGSDTFTFAGATFRREVTRFDPEDKKKPFVEVFSCLDSTGTRSYYSKSGEKLFAGNRILTKSFCRIIVDKLRHDKVEIGKSIGIFGISFARQGDDLFSYVDKFDSTVVFNSSGKILFKARAGKVVKLNKAGCRYIAKQLKDKKTLTIAGVEFTRIDDNVFKYVDEFDRTVVVNSNNEIYFQVNKDGEFYFGSSTKGRKYIADKLNEAESGKITLEGVGAFKKIEDNIFSCNTYGEFTLVFDLEEDLFKKFKLGGLYIDVYKKGCQIIADRLKDEDKVTMADLTFKKEGEIEGDAVFSVTEGPRKYVYRKTGLFFELDVESKRITALYDDESLFKHLDKMKILEECIEKVTISENVTAFKFFDDQGCLCLYDINGKRLFESYSDGRIVYFDRSLYQVIAEKMKNEEFVEFYGGKFTKEGEIDGNPVFSMKRLGYTDVWGGNGKLIEFKVNNRCTPYPALRFEDIDKVPNLKKLFTEVSTTYYYHNCYGHLCKFNERGESSYVD